MSVNRYNNTSLTPLRIILITYGFLGVFMSLLYKLNFYKSDYFNWGPPLIIFKRYVDSHTEFYLLLFMFFINKILNTLVTEIVYTWIVNCIQDPKSKNTYYSRNISLLIILLNSSHLSINSMFTINGSSSQISFLIIDLIGNTLAIFYTNKKFIDRIHNERLQENQELLM